MALKYPAELLLKPTFDFWKFNESQEIDVAELKSEAKSNLIMPYLHPL